MQDYHEAEYCDMNMVLEKPDLEHFIGQLASVGVSLYWKDCHEEVILVATTGIEKKEFHFKQQEGLFELTGTILLHDKRLVNALQYTLVRTKGRAIVKHFTQGPIFISKFRNGEAHQIMEIHGPRKKVVYERPIKVTSDDVIRAFKNREIEQRIPALRLELDYELVSLSDALAAGDETEIRRVKARLEELRREMMMLEVFSQKSSEVLN
ncbi:MAG: hypothetical protein ACXVP5_06450 [Tumebacillaceae bacterium]